MALAKNTLIFNLSNLNLSLSSGSPNKLSRLCFKPLPKHSLIMMCKSAGENAAERSNDMNEAWPWSVEEGNRKAKKRETEKGKEGANRASQIAESAKEKTGAGTQKAEETLGNVKETTKQKAARAKEKTDGAAETMAETAADGAAKVTETAQKMGEKAKNAAKGVWGTAKETTHKIKESVLGPDEQVDRDAEDDDEEAVVLDNPKREEDVNAGKKKNSVEKLGQKKRPGKSDKKS